MLPFTWTRPVSGIRVGILRIGSKWEKMLGGNCSCLTRPHLQGRHPLAVQDTNLLINASLLPEDPLITAFSDLKPGEAIYGQDHLLAACLPGEAVAGFDPVSYRPQKRLEWKSDVCFLDYPEDIFRLNGEAIRRDFALLTKGRASARLPDTNRLSGGDLFIEEDAEVDCANINTKAGPVYIGKGALIMEGTNLRGPLAVCENAVVKMGARIYGPTTIGPECVVGGEVKNSVFTGYSNKGHDGYVGNSVIGEWCNFGAGTNASNMKNNYKTVKRWDYARKRMYDTGLTHCGIMMGDYSRTGINTMLNTGTTIGASCHVFGGDFPGTFIPDFTWREDAVYRLDKALETAAAIHAQKKVAFTEEDEKMLTAVYGFTEPYRVSRKLKAPGPRG